MVSSHLGVSTVEDIRQRISADGARFTTNYSERATVFPSPYGEYVRTVVDSVGSDVKTITVLVWRDDDGDLMHDSDEASFTTLVHIAEY